jgi:hypothetical protein
VVTGAVCEVLGSVVTVVLPFSDIEPQPERAAAANPRIARSRIFFMAGSMFASATVI